MTPTGGCHRPLPAGATPTTVCTQLARGMSLQCTLTNRLSLQRRPRLLLPLRRPRLACGLVTRPGGQLALLAAVAHKLAAAAHLMPFDACSAVMPQWSHPKPGGCDGPVPESSAISGALFRCLMRASMSGLGATVPSVISASSRAPAWRSTAAIWSKPGVLTAASVMRTLPVRPTSMITHDKCPNSERRFEMATRWRNLRLQRAANQVV